MATGVNQTPTPNDHEKRSQLESVLTALHRVRVPDEKNLDLHISRLVELVHAALFKNRRSNEKNDLLLVALFGPSGSGKSTIFNALVGRDLSHTSSIERPATRGAVCALPKNLANKLDQLLFPTLTRSQSTIHSTNPGATGEVTFIPDALEDRLVLIDSPDYDTRYDMNREVARRIMSWADVIILVASVERYADRSTQTEFANLGAIGAPIVAVLNRIPPQDDEIRAAFESELARIGIKPHLIVNLDEKNGTLDATDAGVASIRSALDELEPQPEGNWQAIVHGIRTEVLPRVRDWRRDCDALGLDLNATREMAKELETDSAMGALEKIEEMNKFWLRYSPRGVLKGLKSILTQPSSIFKSNKTPNSADESQLGDVVKAQAWELFEIIQVRTREIMQRHRPGRLFLTDEVRAKNSEMKREDCDALFDELANRLNNFGQSRLEVARREWDDHKVGPIAKARFWALDKVLRLLTLGLTITVLPPLVWELLRFIGHPSFTNEVAAEFGVARMEFRRLLRHAIDDQLGKYAEAIDELGTPQDTAAALEQITSAAWQTHREESS
ncbi:MAG: GTPase SAR1 family protein [Planctomycetota bacterium]